MFNENITNLNYVFTGNRVQSTELQKLNGIVHAFFTRNGGVSLSPYDSLNCGLSTEDDRDSINKNIRIVNDIINNSVNKIDALNVGTVNKVDTVNEVNDTVNKNYSIKLFKQDHTSNICVVDEIMQKSGVDSTEVVADAAITMLPRVLLAVYTADCLPIMLYDIEAKIVAIIHVGWKGAFGKIIKKTIEMMMALFSKRYGKTPNLRAVIGPCIQDEEYVVDNDFYQLFLGENKTNDSFFKKSSKGELLFSIVNYSIEQISEFIPRSDISNLSISTYSNPNLFFSYRRSLNVAKSGIPLTGRNLSVIGLNA